MSEPFIDRLPPVHPGEILRDDLEELGLSARKFADHIGVPANAVTEILNGDRRVTAAMSLRLGAAFGMDDQYWLDLQAYHDTKVARAELGDRLAAIKPLTNAQPLPDQGANTVHERTIPETEGRASP